MFRHFSIFAVQLSIVYLALAGSPLKAAADDRDILIEIDGTAISATDFEQKKSSALYQARNTYYDSQRRALEQFVDEYLLERQAQKHGLTVAELLDRQVNSRVPTDPPDEVLKVYYDVVDTKESFEAARDKMVGYLRERRRAKLKAEYLQSLRAEAKVVFRLEPPRARISLKNTPVRGKPDAPVTVVEFADYECPYCQIVHHDIAKLQAEFGDKVAFAFKDLPLPNHANAQKAAEAAHCAGAQGKYWEYHDILFEKKQYGISMLKEYARGLSLKEDAFDKCLDSGEQAARVKADLDEAQALALPGTPSFFVNGRLLSGAGYEVLRQAVEEELGRLSARRSGTTAN